MNDDPKLTAAIREIDRLYAAGRTADALILTQSLLVEAQKATMRAHYRKHPLPVTYEKQS